MTGIGREEILARYRSLREIGRRHHGEALKFVSSSALLEQARRLGLTVGKTLVAESMDELTLAVDLSLYTAAPGRSRAIDRHARSAGASPGSDDDVVLQAMCHTRSSIWQVKGRHDTAGLLVEDLMRRESVWLVDENLERTAPAGMALALRVRKPEAFAMTCGVIVPVDAALMDRVFDAVLGRVRGEPDVIANDRRFPTALYRLAIAAGIMGRVSFADSD